MSKIYEALQRSESERLGVPVTEESGVVAELLQSAQTAFVFDRYRKLTPSIPTRSRLVCMNDPVSAAAEQFRVLSVRLRNMARTRDLKRILVTSALPGEGKSVCATNLAAALSRSNSKRTLLLEGDLRRPTIRESMGLPVVPGLVEWFRGETELDDVIYNLGQPGFWLLPAGAACENPLEIMQPPKLTELFEHIGTIFDWIIIDSTPLVPLADTPVWSRYADGALLVTRDGVSERKSVRKALEVLSPNQLLGAVLNGCTSIDHARYYNYYSPTGNGEGALHHSRKHRT